MPDADKVLKILIEMGVVGQDQVSAAEAKLAGVGQSAADAADPIKDYDKLLEKLGGTTKEFGHHVNSARLRAELFRRTMMSLGAYTPGLEWAVYGGATAFGALTAGVIGGAIALEKIVEKFKEFDDLLNSQADFDAKPLVDKWGEIQSAIDEASAEYGKFRAKMETAGTDADPVATQLKNEKTLVDEQIKSRRALLEAQFANEEEAIRAGGGSAGDKEAALKSLAGRKGAALAALDMAQADFNFHQVQEKLSGWNEQLKAANKATANLVTPMELAKKKLEASEKLLADLEKAVGPQGETTTALQKARDAYNANEEKINYYKGQSLYDPTGTMSAIAGLYSLKRPALFQAMDNLTVQLDIQTRLLADTKKHHTELSDQAAKLADEYSRASKDAVDYTKRIAELKREFPTLSTAHDQERFTSQTVQALDTSRPDLALNKQAAQNIEQPGGYAAAIRQLAEAQAHGRELAAQAVAAARAHAEALPDISDALKQLRQSNEELMRQIANFRNRPQG